jgi:hypothetical protein
MYMNDLCGTSSRKPFWLAKVEPPVFSHGPWCLLLYSIDNTEYKWLACPLSLCLPISSLLWEDRGQDITLLSRLWQKSGCLLNGWGNEWCIPVVLKIWSLDRQCRNHLRTCYTGLFWALLPHAESEILGKSWQALGGPSARENVWSSQVG